MSEGREPHSSEGLDERRDRVALELEESLMDESFFRGRSTVSDPETDSSWGGRRSGEVLGDFRLISPLGRGGMGQVWEAEQTSMGRKVALKILHAHVQLSDDGVKRFEREAKAGGKLAHPGIVQVHSVGEVDGVHFMAQELVEGGYTFADSLADFRAETELPPGYYRRVAQLFAVMAEALAHAHGNGVVHRDIKPQNILIGSDEKPKVADFGLAMVEDQLGLSRTGDFLGTPFYMSPEQAASRRMGIDHRTDVFSLGATLYEALTLTRPFTGDTSQQVIHQILLVDPPDPKLLRSRVPQDLAVICLKALEKNREQRYATMAEFAADLRRHLADEPIRAKPPTSPQRAVKWVKRNPVKSVGSAVAAAAFVAISALLLAVNGERSRAVKAERAADEQLDRAIAAEAETRGALVEAEEARIAADEAATKASAEAETTQRVLEFMEDVLSTLNSMASLEELGVGIDGEAFTKYIREKSEEAEALAEEDG